MIGVGGVLGYGAAGLQATSGLVQGITMGYFSNSYRDLAGLGIGYMTAQGWSLMTPLADATRPSRQASREMIRTLGAAQGALFGVTQNIDPNFAPFQVDCS